MEQCVKSNYTLGGFRMENATTTIRIKRSTKQKLDDVGRKGMTYDDIINELIDSFTGGE